MVSISLWFFANAVHIYARRLAHLALPVRAGDILEISRAHPRILTLIPSIWQAKSSTHRIGQFSLHAPSSTYSLSLGVAYRALVISLDMRAIHRSKKKKIDSRQNEYAYMQVGQSGEIVRHGHHRHHHLESEIETSSCFINISTTTISSLSLDRAS